ncbi:MAG: HIT family protein [Candidatus Diapherotrites archaeon]|uniref:HIT family protein n=1 Tax=Candidatus Iainarchaeum sp. TaxID=3101447 RepID=A0A8T4C6N5_9ARCH|nr:HIT family protein [Candidatus Diapherotrites archaeon]
MQQDPSCIFCKIIAGEIPSHKIYEDKNYLAFLDIHPISRGHTLVIPKNHSTDLLHATPNERKGLLEIVAKIAPAIMKSVGAKGFNVGINTGKESGQDVFHTHVHIIPRSTRDGLKSWENMPSKTHDLAEIARNIAQNL